jgi:hypothetical protein
MRRLSERELAAVIGGHEILSGGTAAPFPTFGGSTDGASPPLEPVCYPEPNMSTPAGPVYSDGRR